MLYLPIPHERVDAPGPSEALKPYESYFRLWLDELFLARNVNWGVEAFPVVHSEVRLSFAGVSGRTFSTVARQPEGKLAPAADLNYSLTELMPFNGGTVEVQASLLSLPGKDHLGPAVDALAQIGGLVAPPLGQVVTLVDGLASGIRGALDGQAAPHLGLHQTLVSEGGGGTAIMRPGSLAVIRANGQRIAAGDLS